MWPKVANNIRGATFFSAIIVLEELKFRVSGCHSEKKKKLLEMKSTPESRNESLRNGKSSRTEHVRIYGLFIHENNSIH